MRKKFKKALPFFIFIFIFFIFSDQDEYYLGRNILDPTFLQVVFIFSGLFVLFLVIFSFETRKKSIVKYIAETITVSFTAALLLSMLLFSFKPILRGVILFANRLYVVNEASHHYKVYGTEHYYWFEHISEDLDSTHVHLDERFDHLDKKNIHYGDSIVFFMNQGIFGLEYPNYEKTEVVYSVE